jgi:UDP-N-acetylglucosamine--N-acetylmuramyl-(pentapeptide) pyrophosphoryl-undecaprenol N-acetylglucosamine transferase
VRVVIAGGGTGGHLFPGLAVARALKARLPSAQISFAGTATGIEARVIPQSGFELDVIRSAGLKGKSLAAMVRGGSLVPLSAIDAWRVISRRRPDAVIGVGGYSSGPIVGVAVLRGIPALVMEQNAVPGLTNKLLARFVDGAAVTYEASLKFFGDKGFVTGNPVRREFLEISPWPWWWRRRGWPPQPQPSMSSAKPGRETSLWFGRPSSAAAYRGGWSSSSTRWIAR